MTATPCGQAEIFPRTSCNPASAIPAYLDLVRFADDIGLLKGIGGRYVRLAVHKGSRRVAGSMRLCLPLPLLAAKERDPAIQLPILCCGSCGMLGLLLLLLATLACSRRRLGGGSSSGGSRQRSLLCRRPGVCNAWRVSSVRTIMRAAGALATAQVQKPQATCCLAASHLRKARSVSSISLCRTWCPAAAARKWRLPPCRCPKGLDRMQGLQFVLLMNICLQVQLMHRGGRLKRAKLA